MWRKLNQLFSKKTEPDASAPPPPDASPLISFDFVTLYPHKFWISTWSKDQSYPAGFRYKLLSVRDESENTFELVVVLEEPGGIKTEMTRLTLAPESMFDKAVKKFVDDLSARHQVDFEMEDVSDIRTGSDWDEHCKLAEWKQWEPKPPQ